jgi:putative ABC transport system permease protein
VNLQKDAEKILGIDRAAVIFYEAGKNANKYEIVLRIPEVSVSVSSFGGSLDESKVKEGKRVPGVSDAFGLLMSPLDQEKISTNFGRDMVLGISPEKQQVALKDTKLAEGRLLVEGDGQMAVIGSSIAREFELKVGDELEIKSKRLRRSISITHTRNFTVVGILEYTGSYYDFMVRIPLDIAQKFYEQEKNVCGSGLFRKECRP